MIRTAGELLAAHERGERDFHRADLPGANLPGADLSGANLSGADLSGANLSRARLGGASLPGARLSGARLGARTLSGRAVQLGPDDRGYWMVAFATDEGWIICSGCREFTLSEALRHWGSSRYENRARGRWAVRRLKLLWDEGEEGPQ